MANIPDSGRYHTVTPTILVKDAAKLIEFVKQLFDAAEVERFEGPGGAVMHAEVKIGDSTVMLGDAQEEEFPVSLYVYVADVDATLSAGARSGCPLDEGAGRPVLRRPLGGGEGPLRKPLGPRRSDRGRPRRRRAQAGRSRRHAADCRLTGSTPLQRWASQPAEARPFEASRRVCVNAPHQPSSRLGDGVVMVP
jgi:hypothetical protein